ncbi:box C/D snoRNA protein 1 [Toxorhynchites rutilus septentrionalis]|uniref:box C/D snoRNA protein 1 n=1 Tax=Toxorhynchites rutilus septentrionalis TaxID=329112 RepID=UPI00247A041C|nr:box C/D snoRNA protein 1 [Toxorhynchites rutilus septentrionalis]
METSESEDNMDMLQSPPRLGLCEVCNAIQAKYTCPKCEVKSCCVKCINIHKRELGCDGIRDRTKYIPMKKMSKMDMMNDYYFLEECTRYVDERKRDKIKRITRYNKNLPPSLFRLRCAARDRGTKLRFLLQNFSKHQRNTSQLNFKTLVIHWRLEWCFPNAEGLVFVDERCDENEKLYVLLNKYLDATCGGDIPGKNKLEYYQSRGLNQIRVLLKAEDVKRCKNRFFELQPKMSLKENLKGKTIVEYPTIYVIFKESCDGFDVIESDEDVEAEAKLYRKYLDDQYGYHGARTKKEEPEGRERNLQLLEGIDKLTIAKKREERKKRKELSEVEPANLLFSDESLWNQYSSDSGGQETEEEMDTVNEESFSPKRIKTNTC